MCSLWNHVSQSWTDLEATPAHPRPHGAAPSETRKGLRLGGAGPSAGSCPLLVPHAARTVSLPANPKPPHPGDVFPLMGEFAKPRRAAR